MPSIESIVAPFRDKFDPQEIRDRNRLVEAFREIARELGTSSSGTTDLHYARVASSIAINVPNNVATPIPFNQTTNQNGGLHSDSSQNTRLTIFRAGIYFISGHVQWPAAVNGIRKLGIRRNGAQMIASQAEEPPAPPIDIDQSVSTGYRLEVADFIEIIAFQTSGGALNIPVQINYSPEAFIGEL